MSFKRMSDLARRLVTTSPDYWVTEDGREWLEQALRHAEARGSTEIDFADFVETASGPTRVNVTKRHVTPPPPNTP